MPRVLALLGPALNAVSGGQGVEAWIKTMQSIGMGARKSEMRELYKLSVGIVKKSPNEPFRDITQVPTASEIEVWPTKKATGYMQNVTLVYRDRTTGKINTAPWRTSNRVPMVRERAMAMAIGAYADQAERYNQDLIGAVHTGTYQQVPFKSQDD